MLNDASTCEASSGNAQQNQRNFRGKLEEVLQCSLTRGFIILIYIKKNCLKGSNSHSPITESLTTSIQLGEDSYSMNY